MANHIVLFDIVDDSTPLDAVGKSITALPGAETLRLMDGAFYVKADMPSEQVYEHVNAGLNEADRLLVVEAGAGYHRDLLSSEAAIRKLWK